MFQTAAQDEAHANERMSAKNARAESADSAAKAVRDIQAFHPTDLVARVKALKAGGYLLQNMADCTTDKDGVTSYWMTEMNYARVFDLLFIGGRVSDVHCDTSRRMIVDEQGRQIDDIWSPRMLLDAMHAVGLKSKSGNGLSSTVLTKVLRTWALSHQYNDISERVRTRLDGVEWDGRSRLESYLIETLGLEDSDDNRAFSKYWCLSLYCRVMFPGSLAPIAMAMFGAMDAGKSHFQNMICRILLGDPTAAPVTFDPERSSRDLYRDIYGISIIATIPEMTGFGKADIRRMKATLTSTTDTFDQKFGFSAKWPRQFIFVLDGNSYEGLYRDDDDRDENGEIRGERRWFPVFVGQIPGATGNVRWNQEFRVDFSPSVFEPRLWQTMKEAALWIEEHGMDGYTDLVHATTEMVKEFSRREKKAGYGTVRDETFDNQLPVSLYRAVVLSGRIGEMVVGKDRVKMRGLIVRNSDIMSAHAALFKRDLTAQRIGRAMEKVPYALSGRAGNKSDNVAAYLLGAPANDPSPIEAKFAEVVKKCADGRGGADEFVSAFAAAYFDGATDGWKTDGEKAKSMDDGSM